MQLFSVTSRGQRQSGADAHLNEIVFFMIWLGKHSLAQKSENISYLCFFSIFSLCVTSLLLKNPTTTTFTMRELLSHRWGTPLGFPDLESLHQQEGLRAGLHHAGGPAKIVRVRALVLPQATCVHTAGTHMPSGACNPHPGLSAYLPLVLLNMSGKQTPGQSHPGN